MRELTVKEYAERERVHEATVRRWIEKGAIEIRRTPGGGIRVPVTPPAAQSGQASPNTSTR